ncbi:conditioned medium-induced protein 4 [Halosimplex litoreum]|uniref:Conditioned medium-induced protein 4 n=1 Tax=Halosimplex litoreum TaxID=1198301 RepID=A0A7U3WB12_9EURY|nr:conditioned medium-induced protein 4 [Halosimplex litoreum]QPV64807.1 conditioned medium-induced protein 4 [Halosimplex litoreum]
MDEKTAELRDIFMDVSDEETVTETQEEPRGSIADQPDEATIRERLRGVVEALADRYDFDSTFETETYVELVQGFYDEGSDEAIAEELGVSPDEVFRARMDLHLFRGDDTAAPFDVGELRRRRDADDAALADEFDVDESTLAHYRRVVDAQVAARAANYRYRTEFDEICTDAAISGSLTESVTDDGLDEAAEDIETDVSF